MIPNLGTLPARFSNFDIPWGPIGEDVYRRTYSQDKADGTKEKWPDSAVRAVDGNLSLVDEAYIEPEERDKLLDLLMPFGILPAGRHLSASGMVGRQFLFNCFQGETLVLTKEGFKPIKELSGEVEVLSQGEKVQTGPGCWSYGEGVWRKATFKSYGEQELYRVAFSDGSTVEATADHKWYVTKRAGPVETKHLKGHMVPFVTAPKPEKNEAYRQGILHGFVYGDGNLNTYKGQPHSAHLRMFAEKDEALVPLFEDAGFTVTRPEHCGAYVGRLPKEWKFLPFEGSNERSYWYGFVVGLLAADGTVDKGGSAFIYQSDKEALEVIRTKAMECGFACTPISLQREKNPWTGEIAPNWRFAIRRFTLAADEILLTHHRENFILAGDATHGKSLQVVDVVNLHKTEEVFCCVEPETHTIVIQNSMLSGQCHAAGWDYEEPEAHFSFMFDQLMQGGGLGSNYSNRYLNLMPTVKRSLKVFVTCDPAHPNFEDFAEKITPADQLPEGIPVIKVTNAHWDEEKDCREDWTNSLETMVKAAYGRMDFDWDNGKGPLVLVFDVTGIRVKGRPLKRGGGIACGPKPLVELLTDVPTTFNLAVGRRLSSLESMLVDHHEASCVVAGGKRRSSRMSVKSWIDEDIFEFIKCKQVDGLHWSTNISVEIDDYFWIAYYDFSNVHHKHALLVMREAVAAMRANGEPGFWNRSLAQLGERNPDLVFCPNPCGEIALYMWENCNLGHINLQYFTGWRYKDMFEAFRLMARWLIRATFGDIPSPRQRKVVDENRRIGVGFLGFHGWLALSGIKYSEAANCDFVIDTLKKAREVIDEEAEAYSKQLGIPCPVKTTTLAPTGTTALLPGVTSSAQALIMRNGIRRVRYFDADPEVAVKELEGYPVYPDPDAANTVIVEYWFEDPLVTLVRSRGMDPDDLIEDQYEIPLEKGLELQAMLQKVWANNAISFTHNLLPSDMPSQEVMEELMEEYLPQLKGTTVFIEKSRKNSPFERVTKEQWDSYAGPKQILTAEDACKGGCPVK